MLSAYNVIFPPKFFKASSFSSFIFEYTEESKLHKGLLPQSDLKMNLECVCLFVLLQYFIYCNFFLFRLFWRVWIRLSKQSRDSD